MSASLKRFQQATVEVACRTLVDVAGPRRFLVADEVGLGKTVVARDIIAHLCKRQRRPLLVYYVANGQRVGNQNRGRLIDFLPMEERKHALSNIDRLGLIPFETALPKVKVKLYALTPGTSFPGNQTRLHGGRKEERAFLRALLGWTYPQLVRSLPEDLLRGTAKKNWEQLVDAYRHARYKPEERFLRAFRSAVFQEFKGDPYTKIVEAAKTETKGKIIGRLRRALAHAQLIFGPPDLVIFDEFQRYRELLTPNGLQDKLMSQLLCGANSPAVLLLSATPYKLYAGRWEQAAGADHHRELFELIEFLGGDHGKVIRQRAMSAFSDFGDSIRAMARIPSESLEFDAHRASALTQRTTLQGLLGPLMSRTEREGKDLSDGSHTEPLPCELSAEDVRVYRHLVTSFKKQHRSEALPYWLSVPLPMQALGNRYQAWRQRILVNDGKLTKLTLEGRRNLKPAVRWPHPKLRALQTVLKSDSLALPWTAPSLPWWSLAGDWAGDTPEKLLLFSRFKATPQSIAALLSLEVEASYLPKKRGYELAWRQRRLQAGKGRMPILALFHPSPFLIGAVDPMKARGGSLRSVRSSVMTQLLSALAELGIRIDKATAKERKRRRPIWKIISALDFQASFRAMSSSAWKQVAVDDGRLLKCVQQWHKASTVTSISPSELRDLATVALSSPGVVVGRALRRHYAQALAPEGFRNLLRLCWHGLRTYLDNPVFFARLKGRTPVLTLQQAVVSGNLEALLDEHFWLARKSGSDDGAELAEDLCSVLGVTTGSFSFHPIGGKSEKRIRIRCHAAVPFGGTDRELDSKLGAGVSRPVRSDELRKAFNTPFWPHVLATTSVGQEGLDFHVWCGRVAHWDLCSSPLDLEQREGRIQRYGGRLIRRSLAKTLGTELFKENLHGGSIWPEIERVGNLQKSDLSGLSPWWVLPETGVTRYIFRMPHSRDEARFKALQEQRLLYRLALGQPNQEDFVNVLMASHADKFPILRQLALDLSAFGRDKNQSCEERTTTPLIHEATNRTN
jgi:hypothetical protein